MTFLHIHAQGLPKYALGERRHDDVTAEHVRDALRARGLPASAQAMEYLQIDMSVALRVLVEPGRRRGRVQTVAAAPERADEFVFLAA